MFDSLIHSLDNYFLKKSNECIKKCDDIVIYAEESMPVTRKDFFKKHLTKWIKNLK